MRLNKTKLNISVALAVLCDLGGKVFNIRAHWYSLVAQSSLFQGKPALSRNLFLRNEPNFNSLKCITSNCGSVVYDDLQTKTKNGTKPNEANLKPIFEMENPPSSRKIKKMENEPNFNESKVPQVTAVERFTTRFSKRKRTQTNPIKPIKANFLEKTLSQDTARQKNTHWTLLACFGAMSVVYFHRIQILMRFLGLKQA